MNTVDILSIHHYLVRKYYRHHIQVGDASTKDELIEWEKMYNDLLDGNRTNPAILNDIQEKINGIQDELVYCQNTFYFYLLRAIPLLETHQKWQKKQVKLDFVNINDQGNEQQQNGYIQEYLDLVLYYFPLEYKEHHWEEIRPSSLLVTNAKIKSGPTRNTVNMIKEPVMTIKTKLSRRKCPECEQLTDLFLVHDNHHVCEHCGLVYDFTENQTSFKDIDRVNMSSKYTYDRRTHFRDCINQFQGKQNVFVDGNVYRDILEQLVLHHLIPENYKELPKHQVFQNIQKEHVMLFLKETKHTKHYEDVVLIYHQLTGKPAPDISHLENELLQDFDILTELYDKKYRNQERKNFINTQYVLFQLLKRHKYPCKKEDFNILKTVDRKYYHDDICKKLFEELGWNHYALF